MHDGEHHRAGDPQAATQPSPRQIGFLIEGRGVLYIDSETTEMEAQTTFLVPSHSAHNFDETGDTPAVLIEAFAPPREDYFERVQSER